VSLANALTILVLAILWLAALWFGEDSRDGEDWHHRSGSHR
jgi:hypothetical protein